MNEVQVEYYALFREQAGRNNEVLKTQAATVGELYTQLQTKHGFSLDAAQLKVAVNEEFAEWSTEIKDGDSVVFIPPVAGG